MKLYKDHVAEYKIPKYILFMDNFPKSPSGKVITRTLVQKASEIIGL